MGSGSAAVAVAIAESAGEELGFAFAVASAAVPELGFVASVAEEAPGAAPAARSAVVGSTYVRSMVHSLAQSPFSSSLVLYGCAQS